MNQLEQTIVDNARGELTAYLNADASERDKHFHALNALLVFCHQANTGMGEDAVHALRMIESQQIAALRKFAAAKRSTTA